MFDELANKMEIEKEMLKMKFKQPQEESKVDVSFNEKTEWYLFS